jgi:AcrR family transcriptional regulator
VDKVGIGLRERTRRAVRAELVAEAMALFVEKGFDETTVEEIAIAAGLSRRSYFRYFATKDEVLAEGLAEIGRGIADAVSKRPVDEPPWTALRRGFDGLIERAENYPRSRDAAQILGESPALELATHSKHIQWQASIAATLETRLTGPAGDRALHARAIAAAALGCFTVAQAQWHEAANERSLGTLLDDAMSAVHPGARLQ